MSGDERMARRLDQVDRKSQVSVSRAMRARDVSRPDTADIAAALEAYEAGRGGSRGPVRRQPTAPSGDRSVDG